MFNPFWFVIFLIVAIPAGTVTYAGILAIRSLRRGSYLVPDKTDHTPVHDEDYLNG